MKRLHVISVKFIPTRLSRQHGLSLVELMIAVTLGLLVIASVTLLFVKNNRTRTEMQKTSQQIENGRYATQLLSEDLRLAGYYGELNPASITVPTSMPNACASDSGSLTTAIALPVQGFDNGVLSRSIDGASTIACTSLLTDLRAGSDILVIRRASTCVAGSTGCDAVNYNTSTYFQTTLCSTETSPTYVIDTSATSFVLHKKNCTTAADQRAYYTRIYFVTNNNKTNDGIPTLKVAELGSALDGSSGHFNISALVAGIDQLQIEYGLNTNSLPGGTPDHGAPDVYTADPSSYNGCTATSSPTCQAYWSAVTAVKLNVLARNTQTTKGFSASNPNITYVLGNKADGTANSFGPYSDDYKRHVYSTVIRLNNIAGRLE